MKSFIFLSTFCLLLTACGRDSDGEYRYTDFDTNADEGIDDTEFGNAFTTSPYYKQWNDNGDQEVSQSEFARGFFQVIDDNNDGVLSSQEWQQGQEAYFAEIDLDQYRQISGWDQDGDQQVQPNEFEAALNELEYYREWDEDGDEQLSEPEIAQGVFAMWDTDGNGVIEAEEYEEWDDKRVNE